MVTVEVLQGKLKGNEAVSSSGFKYFEFLSIPYARPPVGDLRFKSPQSPEAWDDVRDATVTLAENVSCQIDPVTGTNFGSEDCLYLNVYTPNIDTTQSLLPVMFYIHGGGFVYGNGFKQQQGPEYLVENNVVVVSINYRLGVFGFLNLEIPEASGNMGLKDQVKALEWVQNNIDTFGGDKNNVTIFGISAGSASVEYLMLSPKAKGLFHKAIQQSGASINDWAINYEYDHMNKILLEKLEYKGDITDKRAIYNFLLKVPEEQIVKASFKTIETYSEKTLFFGFVPTIEKETSNAFLTTHPYKLLKQGSFAKIPVIKGFCEKEGLLIGIMKPLAVKELMSEKKFSRFFSFTFNPEDEVYYNRQFSKEYLIPKENKDDEDLASEFFGDLHNCSGVCVSAKMMLKHEIPTYFYQFMYDGNINFLKKLMSVTKKGSVHGDDWTYIFTNDQIVANADEIDILVRRRMTKMWTNFAKTGDPNSSELPFRWPNFSENKKAFLKINKEFTIGYDDDYNKTRMAIFEEIYHRYEK